MRGKPAKKTKPKKLYKKAIVWVLASFLGLISVILLIIFLFRAQIVVSLADKATQKVEEKTNIQIQYGNISVSSLSIVTVTEVNIFIGKEKMLFMDTLMVEPNLWKILFGEVTLSNLVIHNLESDISLLRKIKRKDSKLTDTISLGLFDKIHKYTNIVNQVATLLPNKFKIQYSQFFYADSNESVSLILSDFSAYSSSIKGNVIGVLNEVPFEFKVTGKLNDGFRDCSLDVHSINNSYLNFSILKKKLATYLNFNKASVSFKINEVTQQQVGLETGFNFNGLRIHNTNLSKDTILIDKSGAKWKFVANKQTVSISNLEYFLNKIQGNSNITYHHNDTGYFVIKNRIKEMDAATFIESLPENTFDKIKSLEVEGTIGHNLNLFLKYPKLDSAFVDADVLNTNFRVTNYNETDIRKMNTSFEYQPFNSNRRIIVGEKNPYFIPLNEISPYLQNAVLESEDGDFYQGDGFNEPAFAKVICENIKAKSFKRGGSTITMQLIKNVFLSRKKTIDRKVEEMIITWLIDKEKLVSKRRILEVYFNIIEWGPNVYGIGEAAKYYFNKHPSEITLPEALYLSMIIPSPRYFTYHFDKTGNLREYDKYYFKKISYLMLYRGTLQKGERDSVDYNVILTGEAKKRLKITPDSLSLKLQNDEIPEELSDIFKSF